MQEKRIILSALIFTIILAFSVSAQYETLAGIETASTEYEQYKSCIDSCGQCEANCKTNTYRMAADMQNKEEFCNYLPEAEKKPCKERIYMTKAIAGKDTAECQKITDEFQKSGCLLNVQTEKAISGESEAECDSLETAFAESCRMGFNMRMASLKSDESYCNKIADEGGKAICKSSIIRTEAPLATDKEEPLATDKKSSFEMPIKMPSKSLIIYGIIILGVIIFAVLAVIIIKKRGGKKQPPSLMAQQGPPLVLQKEPVQQFPKAEISNQKTGSGTGVPGQLSGKQKAGETK